jgi:hypothetical protein
MKSDALMKLIGTIALIGTTVPNVAQSASMHPKKGTYEADGLITAVIAEGGATTCPSVNSTISWILTYPGPGKPGAVAHGAGVQNGNFKIAKRIFPDTPAAGATSWSGNITEDFSNGNSDTASFFTTTWQYFDASTLLFTLNIDEPQSAGTCQETIEMTFIKL